MANADDDIYVGQDILSEGREVYEFQWHHDWNKVTKNKNGTTGWARILQSTNPTKPPGTICRMHQCAYNPCTANWKPVQYGNYPPPLHVQLQNPSITFAAVAGASGAQSSSSNADLPVQAVPEEEASALLPASSNDSKPRSFAMMSTALWMFEFN